MCSRALADDSSSAAHADLARLPRASGPARGLQRGPAPAIATLPRRAADRAAAAEARLGPDQRVLVLGADAGSGGEAVARLAAAAGAAVTVRADGLAGTRAVAAVQAESEAAFDRILLLGVLERVPDPHGTLTACCSLLAPGGRLVVSVPPRSLGGQIYRLQRRLAGVRVALFRPSSLARVGRDAGVWTRAIVEPTTRCTLIVFEAEPTSRTAAPAAISAP